MLHLLDYYLVPNSTLFVFLDFQRFMKVQDFVISAENSLPCKDSIAIAFYTEHHDLCQWFHYRIRYTTLAYKEHLPIKGK